MKRNYKRIFSFLLAFVMVIGFIPMNASAAENGTNQFVAYAQLRSTNELVELENCLYTFDLQDNGRWYITAKTADNTTIYLDPHYRANNTNYPGYPGRTGAAYVDLYDGYGENAVKLHDDTGYLHSHTEKAASAATWNQCGGDENNTKHDVLLYRPAAKNEASSTEIPGFVRVTVDVVDGVVSGVSDGDRLLIVSLHNDGSRSIMVPSSSTSSKESHIGVLVIENVEANEILEVYQGHKKTMIFDGEVSFNAEGVTDIAQVTAQIKTVANTGRNSTFADGNIPLADCEYTFDKQDDSTWLIHADVDGTPVTPVYVDPHAGAGNSGYPNRTYQTNVTLEPSTNGAVKFRQLNEGYLHFWHNDDSKLYWDQCTNDGAGHDMLIYRRAGKNEQSSTEVPGYVHVANIGDIVDGGEYLIVSKANSGGYYAMRPCKTTSSKYDHICKVAGVVTELTVTGINVGSGNLVVGDQTIIVNVLDPENLEITLNYNYQGAPANGRHTVAAGNPIGQLPVPMRQGYTFYGWYLNGTKVTPDYVVTEPVTLTADWISVTKKDKPANGTANGSRPFPETYPNGNPYNYRIPGIVAMADGTVVAMADARWNTEADSSGHDTIVSVSKDNGKTWEYTYANYLGDSNDVRDIWASMFIDPAIATDGETLYMIADLFPAGVSTQAAALRSQRGSNGFNAEGKLMLRDLAGDTCKFGNYNERDAYLSMATSRSYDFYLDPSDNGYTIRRKSDNSAVEGYTVDKMFNIRSTDGTISTHLFLADSPFQVYPTNYLYLTKSTDGLNWSEPELITAKNADESAFLIGPGSGTYDADGGRIIFTAYCHGGSLGERTCLLWAGEDGVWHRSEDVGFGSSEATAVVLDNGSVRVFYRTGGVDLRYTDYKWNGSEYVRDTNNIDVDTGVDRKNTCMLTAYKYPEKVNGREMILVAAPNAAIGSTYDRRDGRIYAFYVNKDGSMEHVATYNVAPEDDNEWYGYSCLTVLNKGDEAGSIALFWEDAWSNNPPVCTIKYSVIALEDVLAGVEPATVKEVDLTVGKTATFEDETGYYVGENTSELDTDVAAVKITGTATETNKAAGENVSAIADGTYVIINTRAGKPLTNGTASADNGNGLSMNASKDNVPEVAIWTVKAANGGYTVQDSSGNYLTVGSNTAGLATAETVIRIDRNGNTWTINQNGAYLNDFGGKGICAAGWNSSSAKNDAGSQWQICPVVDIPVAGTSEITFTGVGVGKTNVLIGNTIYNITVTEPVHTHTPAAAVRENEVAPTCTKDGSYDSVVYCSDCGEVISRESFTVDALGHNYETIDGILSCTKCGEVVHGVFEDRLYNQGVLYKAYQLVNFEGDFYFINGYDLIAKDGVFFLSEKYVAGKTFDGERAIPAGLYEFDENGKMIIPENKNGIVGDYFYINGVKQLRYQLIQFEGAYYFLNDGDKIAKNCSLYLRDEFVEGTGLKAGLYKFDAEGKMIVPDEKHGVVGEYLYLHNELVKAYQLVNFEGHIYFAYDSHKLAKNCRLYLGERFAHNILYGENIPVGFYEFDNNGWLVMP